MSEKLPPVIGPPASGWPMVPLTKYTPPVLVPPPPETLYQSMEYCWLKPITGSRRLDKSNSVFIIASLLFREGLHRSLQITQSLLQFADLRILLFHLFIQPLDGRERDAMQIGVIQRGRALVERERLVEIQIGRAS